MMNTSENNLKTMITKFNESDLRILLETFGFNNRNCLTHELLDKALELLTTKPPVINFKAYASKIVNMYLAIEDTRQKNQTSSFGLPAQKKELIQSLPRPYPQNRSFIPSVSELNKIRYVYRAVPLQLSYNQQPIMLTSSPMVINRTKKNNYFSPCIKSIENYTFQERSPFFETIDVIFKPSILMGHEKCTLLIYPIGTREFEIKFNMSAQHASDIALYCNSSIDENGYCLQIQLRLGVIEEGSTVINDCMPLGFYVRICNQVCPLPPLSPPSRKPGARRLLPRPINCTELLKLNSTDMKFVNLNWYPDGKNYVIGLFLVKQLSIGNLVQKLMHRKARSSEDTKRYIIKKSSNIDTELSTIHHRISLMCPLSTSRMKLPTKSVNCDHLQCFDATVFISMNEKKPTWICPICNMPCAYDDLEIQTYFLEIINSSFLPENCQQIELLPDGSWKVYEEIYEIGNKNGENPSNRVKKHSRPDCPKYSEELNSVVIDLTLSDDEEPTNKKSRSN